MSPREEDHWPRFRSVAGVPVKAVDPPDYEAWLRTADIDRISRIRDSRKAQAQMKLKSKSSNRSETVSEGKKKASRKSDKAAGEGSRRRKKTRGSKGADSGQLKFGARGQVATRQSRRRPIAKGEKPGGGVKRISRPE